MTHYLEGPHIHLIDRYEFDIKDEDGVGRNDTGETSGTVGEVRAAGKLSLLTNAHLKEE